MITKNRKKSQVTVPKELIDKLGIKAELFEIKKKIKIWDQPVFDTVDDLFDQLDNESILR